MKKLKKIRAFVSVTDKSGLAEFLKQLGQMFNLDLIATTGTGKYLSKNGLKVALVKDLTDYPYLLNGRVKSIHPIIYAGILADQNNPEHVKDLQEHAIKPFDMVVINFYQFEQNKESFQQAVENIDIGGPAAIRAAAKNFQSVIPICSAEDYEHILHWLEKGNLDFKQRLYLAEKIFHLNKDYNNKIAQYLGEVNEPKL
jgi:phosphoribosylaminoimidazolecarboxamide formyltransferase/IMP cyclohydrolase